jgi:hypothetical protein
MGTNSFLNRLFGSIVFLTILYASYLLILLSLPYIYFEKNVEFLLTKQLIYHIRPWRYSFYIHVFSSPIVILTRLHQFTPYIILKRPKLHRRLGYTYSIVVLLISGPSALIMSFYANGGYPSQVSFVLLTLLWITFTALSLIKAKNGKYISHARWNIRGYALTLSAVTLRFYLYLFDSMNLPLDPKTTYIIVSYLSWTLNLLFAELLIKSGYANRMMK